MRLVWLVVAALLLLPATTQAAAEDWQLEWQKTLAAAKREGSVVVAESPNLLRRDFLLQRWKQDFPDIALSLTTVRGSSFVATVATERSAGKFLWDVYQSGPTSGIEAVERFGFFDPLLPELILPEVSDPAIWGGWDDAFYDPDRKYVIGLISDVIAPYYNAALVPPAEVESQGLKLLLDPAYKGRIVWYDPRLDGVGSLFLPLLVRHLGEAGLRRLIVDQDPIFVDNLNAVGEAIVRKKAVIALSTHPTQDLKPFLEAGIQLDVRSFGAGPATAYRNPGGSALALFNRRPHPAAARIFVNWYMTKSVSEGVSRATSFDSRRTDLAPLDPAEAAQRGGDYVEPQRGDGLNVLRKWRLEAKRLRPQ